ncbi:MHS family MFS transporter [Leucobacter weissii]|uniref:MHS family MFS transporter n=1 Tax=Leucobacter weissii TaxID=1983706 RepID=A0A939MQC5_9MICO|nr:MHS family MFS transporter [Leucobacter weissii]
MTETPRRPETARGSETDAPVVNAREAGRIARAAFVGTALEWYDYYLFGTAAAIVFNRLYFTTFDPVAATLASLATFGVGFVARPVGAFVFGIIGDRVGRRPALVATIVLIGCATGLVGLLPAYADIGVVAPVALAVLRILQGLAVGGEWGGATTIAVEHAPVERRARYAALVQIGSPVGTLLASGAFAVVLLLPSDSFDAWGWRLPFLAAFPLLIIALWIRLKVEESPIFKSLVELDRRAKIPALDVFRKSPRKLVLGIATSLIGIGGFYVFNTFAISYTTTTLGLERQLVVNATLFAAVLQLAVIPLAGFAAERLGAWRITLFGSLIVFVSGVPLFWMIDTSSPVLVTVAIIVGINVCAIPYAVNGALLAELFSPEQRYSGISLSYNIAGALSGFLPFIATALIANAAVPSSWPAVAILLALAALTGIGGLLSRRHLHPDRVVIQEA